MEPTTLIVIVFKLKLTHHWFTYPQFFKTESEAEAVAGLIEDDHDCETDLRDVNVGVPGEVYFEALTNLNFN